MSINIMQGALAAAILESRGADRKSVLSGAVLSAFMPGVLGLAVPLILSRKLEEAAADGKKAAPAAPPDAPPAAVA